MPYYDQYKIISFSGGTYPNLYLVDDFGGAGNDEVNIGLSISQSSHGFRTIETIKSIANHVGRGRRNLKMFKSNIKRSSNPSYPSKSTVEALFSILMLNTLQPGDVLIANVETELDTDTSLAQNSIINETICKEILINLTKLGVIVIVPAGNLNEPIADTDFARIGDIIVVGSFTSGTSQTHNRYNQLLTCFAEDSIILTSPNPDITFSNTSAATAQIAGFIMQMQKYAKSRGSFLTPSEVKSIVNTFGNKINITTGRTPLYNCNVPTWTQALMNEIVRTLALRNIPPRSIPPRPIGSRPV